MKIILDIETTRAQHPVTGKYEPTVFNAKNKLVTVQWKILDTDAKQIAVFNHKEYTATQQEYDVLQDVLDSATTIIGHNLKFDVTWLLECGFTFPEDCKLYDTMIFEYVCGKGIKKQRQLGLAALAEEYGLPLKLDILSDYWDKGVNTDEVPLQELTEYALQDIDTTEALYNMQRQRYADDKDVKFMWKAIQLSNEALSVIIEMERNGCFIDQQALGSVEKEYREEFDQLDRAIKHSVAELTGDIPIDLDSNDYMSELLYGIKVIDKKEWAHTFGIGSSDRNGIKKKKYPKNLKPTVFKKAIKELTVPIYRQTASQCPECYGRGVIRKIKKDGSEYKKDNICPSCKGEKVVYTASEKQSGLRLKPLGPTTATLSGFAADKKAIEQHLLNPKIKPEIKALLKALIRHSAISTYMSTFIEGIRNNVREDLLLHTSLNQCVTATGRLSSSNPNFQNLPRGATFPVRKAIVSRFAQGSILEVDFAGLEYRVAVMLSECPVGLESILSGKDRHQITAEIINGIRKEDITDKSVWKEIRQAAKPHTFKPLYFGQSGTEDEQRYYKAFMDEHIGIRAWHEYLCNQAINEGQIDTPFHRIFAFPNARRSSNGKVSGSTQIVNYPVQSVATADIIWLVICQIHKKFKAYGFESKLILQVHDAVLIDVHPSEKDNVLRVVKTVFDSVPTLMEERYFYTTKVPLGFEAKIGPNWGEQKEITI